MCTYIQKQNSSGKNGIVSDGRFHWAFILEVKNSQLSSLAGVSS